MEKKLIYASVVGAMAVMNSTGAYASFIDQVQINQVPSYNKSQLNTVVTQIKLNPSTDDSFSISSTVSEVKDTTAFVDYSKSFSESDTFKPSAYKNYDESITSTAYAPESSKIVTKKNFKIKVEDFSGEVIVDKKIGVTFDSDVVVSKSVEASVKPVKIEKTPIDTTKVSQSKTEPQKFVEDKLTTSTLTKSPTLTKFDDIKPAKENIKIAKVEPVTKREARHIEVDNLLNDVNKLSVLNDSPVIDNSLLDVADSSSTTGNEWAINNLDTSLFLVNQYIISDSSIDRLQRHVANGGLVTVKGTSSSNSEKNRVKFSNARALETARALIKKGIDYKSIKLEQISSYKNQNDRTGVLISLTNKGTA